MFRFTKLWWEKKYFRIFQGLKKTKQNKQKTFWNLSVEGIFFNQLSKNQKPPWVQYFFEKKLFLHLISEKRGKKNRLRKKSAGHAKVWEINSRHFFAFPRKCVCWKISLLWSYFLGFFIFLISMQTQTFAWAWSDPKISPTLKPKWQYYHLELFLKTFPKKFFSVSIFLDSVIDLYYNHLWPSQAPSEPPNHPTYPR